MVDINDGGYDNQRQVPPIAAVCDKKHLNILNMLLGQGNIINVNKISCSGNTALILATHLGWTAGMKLLLKTNRCDLNIRDRGDTALDIAQIRGHKAYINALEAAAVKYAGDNELIYYWYKYSR